MIRDPKTLRLAWALLLLSPSLLLLPQGEAAAADRPRIGLALGGGGARGAAHVGVLKRLEELGVPVDYVAGTSMGSIVGGLYAMGMSPDEIQKTIEEIDWDAIFQDEPPRQERRYRRKQDDRSFLIKAKPGVIESERKVELVPALIQGQKLDLALRRYTLPASEIHDFDDLRIPFRAVATDVVSGDAAILGEGDLAQSIRASMAVPAIFAPVEIGDRLLVDGGLAMNLPVSAVREMGADIVIAVDVGGPRRGKEEIGNVLAMLDQVAALVTARNTDQQIASLGPRDILIVPPLGKEVLASDFDKQVRAIAIGETGANAKGLELKRLALAPSQYAAYRAAHSPREYSAPTIDYIRIENDSKLADSLIERRFDVKPGDRLNPDAIEPEIARIYDLDNFESVRYRVERRAGETGLVLDAEKKSWGTSSIQAGLELSSTGEGDSMFNIGAAYTMAPLNELNGEWRTLLRAGEEPGLTTGIYQPLDPAERWYAQLGGGYQSENLRVFAEGTKQSPTAEYQLNRWGGLLEAGRNLGDWGRLGLRYSRYAGDADLRIGPSDLSGYKFDVGQMTAGFWFDSLDSLNFPRSGWGGQVYAVAAREALGSTSDYDLVGFDVLRAGTWKKDSLLGALSLAANAGGTTPPEAFYRLGGFLNLSGFNQRELSGPYAGLARGIYLRDLGTKLVKTYAGASLEFGNAWQDQGDIRFDNTHVAGSVFLGADTILGPVYVGYGYADGGNDAVYLYLGRPWLLGLKEW